MALGPLLLGPLSEFYGRRPIYLGSMGMLVIWLIPEAVAQNLATVIVGRFFDGFAGSAFLAVAAGSVVDLFDPSQIHTPMNVFTISPFLGPVMGLPIGSFINEFTSWRWTYYTLLIWSAVLFVVVLFLLPETYHKVLLKRKALQQRTITGNDRWFAQGERNNKSVGRAVLHSCYTPFKLLLFEPMCLLLCLYSAILLGIIYLFFGAFPLVFGNNHNFNLWQTGLTFLGMGVGMVLGILTNPIFYKIYLRLAARQQEAAGGTMQKPESELRLIPTMVGAPMCVVGLFWFGWTTYTTVHWIVPIFGSAFFGAGVILVFIGVLTFLVDAYPAYAASASAANAFVRLLFAAAFPLFGNQMYNRLGYQWATSLLGFLALACLPFPFLFFRYGKALRARSNFSP